MSKMIFLGTPGPWSIPHLCDNRTTCNCSAVLCDYFCGSVANVNHSPEGADWREGDNPPIDQAIHNGMLISAAPDLLLAAMEMIESVDNTEDNYFTETQLNNLKLAVNKALGINE